MFEYRIRPATLALWSIAFLLLPNSIGRQDLAALLAQQPGVSERWRAHVMASPFGTIHAATFSLPRPVGTMIPQPISLTPNVPDRNDDDMEATGRRNSWQPPAYAFPKVNQSGKSDRLPAAPLDLEPAPSLSATPVDSMTIQILRLYFDSTEAKPGAITPWNQQESEAPVSNTFALASVDTNAMEEGTSIAGKGQIIGENHRPKTPAEHFGLSGNGRAKAEKCIADAIYFEARSEPVRGQVAVAQVVLNRALSGFYPNDICGVVYQNAHRRLACQFTFACDGIRDVVTEIEHWSRAKTISSEILDGKLWLPEVGKATHYHASYVRPYWVRSMRKHEKIGLHTFYRPREWGNGEDAPSFETTGNAAAVEKAKL